MRCAGQSQNTTMWRPISDFEDEMMDMQPQHDLIFADYGRNPASLAGPLLKDSGVPKIFQDEQESPRLSDAKNKELHLVSKIRGLSIGRRLEEEDLEDSAEREAETIAMIRNSGYALSIDVPLTSKKTLPTFTPSQSYKISNGCPVLFDPECFKLKPRNPDSDTSANNTIDLSGSLTDSSSFLEHFRTINISQEDENSSKLDSDNENNNVHDKPASKVTSSVPDIISRMKQRRRMKLGGRTVPDNESDESNNNKKGPSSSQHEQTASSQIVFRKKFITPKELYLKKRVEKS